MSLEAISEMITGPTGTGQWQQLVESQLQSLTARIERMKGAKAFLEHVASHHQDSPDGCPHYETLIWERTTSAASHHGP